MPYNGKIPDAPIAVSMLPRATELTLDDLLVLTQPGNPIGQKSRSLTLQALAAFLGDKFNSIVLQGSDGKSLTLTGNGTTFAKPHTSQSDLRDYTIVESDDGITLQVTGPTGTQKVVLDYKTFEISSTANEMTQKLTLGQSGITISNQTRVNGQVVTTTSSLNSGELDISMLKVLGEDNSDWKFETFKQQSTQQISKNDLLIGEGLPSLAVHIFSKLKVWRQTYFDKDVEINGDLRITNNKTLKVTGQTTLAGVGLDVVTLNTSTDGGTGCWLCSAHGPNYLFYNQSASNGQIWHVINDTGNDVSVAYDYYSSSSGGRVDITKNIPANSCAAFLRRGTKWFQMV